VPVEEPSTASIADIRVRHTINLSAPYRRVLATSFTAGPMTVKSRQSTAPRFSCRECR